MNQSLQTRFAAELKELTGDKIPGVAVKKYLLEQKDKIKIPNVIYCVLQMLGDEYENSDVIYKEYYGLCPIKTCKTKCPFISVDSRNYQWIFWYINHKDILNIAGTPDNSLKVENSDCAADNNENVVHLDICAKLAYQCMVIYNTEYECYLPSAVFNMSRYVLLLLSYKAFFVALQSAINYHDEGLNYIIKEVLETVLGLKNTDKDKIYNKASLMRGAEKAAIVRMIAKWKLGGDLQERLCEIIDDFAFQLTEPKYRELVKKQEKEVKRVLGEPLFYHFKEHVLQNEKII